MAAVRAGHAAPVAGGDPMRFVSLVRGGRTWGEVGARASVWSEVGATLLNFAQLCSTLLNFAQVFQNTYSKTHLTQVSRQPLLAGWSTEVAAGTAQRSNAVVASRWAELVLCSGHTHCASRGVFTWPVASESLRALWP